MNAFKETTLADHSRRAIASEFASALLDLTGNVYEVEIQNWQPHSDGTTEIHLGAARRRQRDTGR